MAGSAGMSVIMKDGTSFTTSLYSPSILANVIRARAKDIPWRFFPVFVQINTTK